MAKLYVSVSIFDGEHEELAAGMSVLAEGNEIAKTGKVITSPDRGSTIDGLCPHRVRSECGLRCAWRRLFSDWLATAATRSGWSPTISTHADT